MKILVVGGGGREHAIVKKLSESRYNPEIYCAPGNGGIAQIATCLPIKATDVDGIVNAAIENKIDLVFVAPDDPLMLGTVDALEAKGIRAFGPHKCAAII
jgi:phosphoribosylamine--glycine ligase